MRTLELNNDIQLTDGTHRVVGRGGNFYQLKNQSTGDYTSATLSDIFSRLVVVPIQPVACSPYAVEKLTDAEQEKVDLWVQHLEEMEYGTNPKYAAPRPEYDPALTTLNERVAAKGRELVEFRLPSSRATLMAMRRRYREGGPAALLDRRKNKKVGYFDRTDTRVMAAMDTVSDRQKNKSTVTQKRLHELVRNEVMLRHPGEGVCLPSTATMYRHFKTLSKGKYTTEKATSRRSKANVRDHTFGGTQRWLPGEEVQIDSTKMEVYVKTKDLKTGETALTRPILTVLIDIATRTIIAYSIRLEGAKGYDHALLLAGALIPFALRPNNRNHRTLLSHRFPDQMLLSGAERDFFESSRPFIYPKRIVIDNGKDFASQVFQSACAKYGIDLTNSAPHTPSDKPHVERNFSSISSMFTQDLPGYLGNSPVNRGYKVEEDCGLDVAILNELFGDWVAKVWQNREHGGLRDLYEPEVQYSPNVWYNATVDLSGDPLLPQDFNAFIDLMPSVDRVISSTGVRRGNRHYDSTELHPYRNMPSNRPGKGNLWEVKHNPYDVTRVWVRSPEGNWIECTWKQVNSLYQPHVPDVMQNLRESSTERNQHAITDFQRSGLPVPDPLQEPEDTFDVDAALQAIDNGTFADFELFEDEEETE